MSINKNNIENYIANNVNFDKWQYDKFYFTNKRKCDDVVNGDACWAEHNLSES